MRTYIFVGMITLMTMNTVGEPSMSNAPVLLEIKNDPTISIRLWFKVGSQNDPVGKEGLAEITSSMLTDAATKRHSYEQILDKLFPLASGYSASTSVEMTVLYGRTHKDNLSEYYPLFMDAVTTPAFKQEDLDRIKSQTLNYLENTLRFASDEELGKAVLYNDIFRGSGYGHTISGTIEGVKSITLKDVQAFYKKFYTRENVVIGLGGGFDKSLYARVRKDIDRLPSKAPKPAPIPVPAALTGFNMTIVEKDAASTALSIGFPINLLRGTKEWYALAIANSWLGEHRNSSSHLYQVIREERGLNYGDYSYIENFPRGGSLQLPPQNVGRRQQIFEIWIRPVPNEARHFALRAALREFKKLLDNGMSAAEFELTRNFLKKYVLHFAPTTMERVGYALDDRFYGITGSHLEKYRAMMDEITLDDVNAAIRKHWQFESMRIVAITKDAEGFKKALVNNEPSPITYPAPKSAEILREDEEIISFPIPLAPQKIRIVPMTDLFLR